MLGRTPPEFLASSEFICADLLYEANLDLLIKESGATHLIHLAWYAEHGKYWTSPLNLRWVEATVKLVEAFCRNGGQKVIAAGTCAEYNWSYGYCREDVTPIKPVKMYGVAKDATRRLISEICVNQNVKFVWGRIFIPYGKGEDSDRLIPSLIDVFQGKKQPFRVNAHSYRDFLHVIDLADAFIKLLQEGATGIYNVCSGQPLQIGAVVRIIAKVNHMDPNIVLDISSAQVEDENFIVGDNQKLQQLDWIPRRLLSSFKSLEDY